MDTPDREGRAGGVIGSETEDDADEYEYDDDMERLLGPSAAWEAAAEAAARGGDGGGGGVEAQRRSAIYYAGGKTKLTPIRRGRRREDGRERITSREQLVRLLDHHRCGRSSKKKTAWDSSFSAASA